MQISKDSWRFVSIVSSLALAATTGFLAALQPGCGRSDLEITCLAHRYRITPTAEAFLLAVVDPGEPEEVIHFFSPPSYIINEETHQVVQANPDGEAAMLLRAILADATVELCRVTLEDADSEFDFRTRPNNCGQYEFANISLEDLEEETVGDTDFDAGGPTVELNPACFGACLLDECSIDETGGHDPLPDHPFARTVRCKCQLEAMDGCSPLSSALFPPQLANSLTDDFCVPAEEESPANYCRTTIADYFDAGVRALNHYGGVHDPYDGECGSYTPALMDVVVECVPIDAYGNILEDASEAYTQQNDACAPGCSNLACDELQNQFESPEDEPCAIQGPGGCEPENCTLDAACDCDILPEDCFEDEVLDGVCLPELIGGADGGSDDDGGGGAGRLRSSINLLHGSWLPVTDLDCAELEPGGSFIGNVGDPPPSSTVSPYGLTNGTSYAVGLQVTCPAPATDDVEISTFDTSLKELCRLIPLCELSSELSLTLTASEGTSLLASGTLEKSGATITTTEAGAPLSVGTHTVDLCVEHDPSGVEACSAQSIRAAAPLGSGVDGFGYFAGELALDFVATASKPGAVALSLTDDGYARISLPSGFDFPFYGTTVSTYLYVGANGGINTTNAPIAAANTGLPASTLVNAPDIAVYWDDLDPSSGGGVYAWFDGTRLIVSWEDVPHGRDASSSTSQGISVQAHIYESGRIELHYLDTDVGDAAYDHGRSATLGVGNLAGTQAVEITYDSDAILTSGVAAVGIARSSDGCLADGLIIPPEVACTASDHSLTVCTPTGDMVTLPLPDVSECSSGSVGVEGEVIESGTKETTLAPLAAPIAIDQYGNVELDEGAHRIRWWPIDGAGDHVGPSFTQLVLARTWVHDDCGGSGQSMLVLTEDDDTYVATEPDALALIGRYGEDVLTSSAGDDFIGDGPDAGICEANEGADHLVGEDGDDTLDGGPGADHAWGGSGDDLLVGGTDADALDGQDGHDILQGDAQDDVLWGGLGDDVLEGGDGADTLVPGSGIDAVYGGLGDDTIVILAVCELTSGKLLSGGDGTDRLLLPPGLDLEAVENAGVTVDADIESVETSTELPTHRAACEPS